jgi:desampylase
VIARLVAPAALLAQIGGEAHIAFPRECCGLLEGLRREGAVEIVAIHPTPNLAGRDDAFAIDPAAHIALLRRLRGTGRAVVGCYHSHPNGRAEPSERDLAGAREAGFVWLIAALSGQGACTVNAFIFQRDGFLPLTFCEGAEPA